MAAEWANFSFPPKKSHAIICQSVWLYIRFALSFRNVKKMLAKLGNYLSHETIWRRILTLGSAIMTTLCIHRAQSSGPQHPSKTIHDLFYNPYARGPWAITRGLKTGSPWRQTPLICNGWSQKSQRTRQQASLSPLHISQLGGSQPHPKPHCKPRRPCSGMGDQWIEHLIETKPSEPATL